VFAERGIGAARHAEIAERADVAVSTTFVYFPTREQLVEDVLDEVARFFLERLEFVHGQNKSCVEILREIGDGFLDLLRTHRSHVLLWLEWGAAFTERAVAITRRTLERGQLEGSVAPEADTESLARLFASSSQSIARLQLGDVDRQTIRRFQDTVLRAIVTEESLETGTVFGNSEI
jgi:TetR/AcrR family hemagglutinin/protease transcriptional regulator